jgi:signal transduction histidine kinase
MAAGLISAILYVPHILTTWSHEQHYAIEQYADIFMFAAVGVVTGILSDRERSRRAELQVAAQQLKHMNMELQNTFEQVKRADRLSAIGQLAAGLAHEIRNPLASIDGAAEVLEPGGEPEEVRRESLAIIRKECARLFRLLTNLLDFARPREPERRAVAIPRVLDKVIELVGHSGRKGIRFHREAPDDLPPLMSDEEQLTQVILNLAINAAQAMPEGGDVRLAATPRDGGIVIEVKDQGHGIPPDQLDRIFDPFFTTKDEGTGLGLSVVDRIVSHHGGSVTVKRNRDKGMTFTLFFPRPASDNHGR